MRMILPLTLLAIASTLGAVDAPPEYLFTAETDLSSSAPRIRTDIHAVFVSPGKGGLRNLDWVQFNAK